MTPLRAWILTSAAALCLSGCQTTSDSCVGWKPIRPTQRDLQAMSDRLVTQLIEHNEHGRNICGWRAK